MLRSLMEHTHADLFLLHAGEQAFGTLYIGVTNNIIGRVERHRAGEGSTHTRKYRVHRLVWSQQYGDIREAIQREKTM